MSEGPWFRLILGAILDLPAKQVVSRATVPTCLQIKPAKPQKDAIFLALRPML